MNFMEIKAHTHRKYSILGKYLGACKKFDDIYQNFTYVETHGGTGQVIDYESKKPIDGSVLIAAKLQPSFPCHVVEIDPENYKSLQQSTQGYSNITLYPGDCNDLIHTILDQIPKGRKFVLCYVDPSGLVYKGPGGVECYQLRSETIQTIANFPRSELLLNFPLEAIIRCSGDYYKHPDEPRAQANGENVTAFMGSETWQELPKRERSPRDFLELYMGEQLMSYPYKGAILVRSEARNLPMYYLIYTTHNPTAAKIMRYIMRKEGDYPIHYDLVKGRAPTLDEAFPLDHYIFEK